MISDQPGSTGSNSPRMPVHNNSTPVIRRAMFNSPDIDFHTRFMPHPQRLRFCQLCFWSGCFPPDLFTRRAVASFTIIKSTVLYGDAPGKKFPQGEAGWIAFGRDEDRSGCAGLMTNPLLGIPWPTINGLASSVLAHAGGRCPVGARRCHTPTLISKTRNPACGRPRTRHPGGSHCTRS